MKFELDDNKIVIYVYKKCDKNEALNEIIRILEEYYNISINKENLMNVYINEYYGFIFEIYINKYGKLKIFNNSLFLYKIDDPLNYLNQEIYYYKGQYYLNNKKNDIRLIENSNIIYSNYVYRIIANAIKI